MYIEIREDIGLRSYDEPGMKLTLVAQGNSAETLAESAYIAETVGATCTIKTIDHYGDAIYKYCIAAIAKAWLDSGDVDPTPYCVPCNAKTKSKCDCGPRAENE